MRNHVHDWLRTSALALGLALASPTIAAYADNISVVVQRVDTSQFPNVRTYVSITNANGVPINGLDSQSLVVQEDGKAVDGLVVNPTRDVQEPIVTAMVFDVGDNMAKDNRLEQAKAGAYAYIDSLGPNDRASIVSYASRVTVVQDYTSDKAALKSAVESLTAHGGTLLYDAIDQTARRQAAQTEGRKPIILLTDSQDATSSVPLGVAIATATTAGTPIYSLGLGGDVDKGILTQLSQATGGQAVFTSDPNDLKATFLSIDDFLRREYVLRYTSKLSPDATAHGLAVQATANGQQATGLKSFTVPTATKVTITGLSPNATVSGIQHVTVDVSGGAQSVQLLLDDQVRASTTSIPAVFDWDTSQDKPGAHKVVVRVTDAQGVASDSVFAVAVGAASPSAPTPAPTPAPNSAPTPTPDTSFLLVGGVVLLLLALIAASAWLLGVHRRSSPLAAVPPTQPAAPQPTLPRRDITEPVLDGVGPNTRVREVRERLAPQVHLGIVYNGRQGEVSTREFPILLGRLRGTPNSVPLEDPRVSSQHARIRRDGAQFVLEDLKSSNGTQVNGEPIPPETPRPLKPNDRIYLGDTVVTFTVDGR